MCGRQSGRVGAAAPWGSSSAQSRRTGAALLPGRGSERPLGDMGGSQRPSVVIVPVSGVGVGRGVRVKVGSKGVRVAGGGVVTSAVCVRAGMSAVSTGVEVNVSVGEGVELGEGVAEGVTVGDDVREGLKLGYGEGVGPAAPEWK